MKVSKRTRVVISISEDEASELRAVAGLVAKSSFFYDLLDKLPSLEGHRAEWDADVDPGGAIVVFEEPVF